MNTDILLSLDHIVKIYSGVTVLHGVSLDIRKGEIHALVGANGAGKSTLMKTISGAITPESGKIIFDGREYDAMTPQLSGALGIEIIYQEFNLVPSLTVAENIFLGNKEGSGFLVNFKAMQKKADEILKEFGLDIKATDYVKNLSVAYKQIVEIAKALSRDVKLLILDEPTAPLTNSEVEVLYRIVKELKQKGVSIIYISHRLEEVFELSDRITVLRDGYKITTLETAGTNRKELIGHMINSDLGEEYPPRSAAASRETLLEVRNLRGKGFHDISFKVHRGEILGIAGLVGAKRTEIVRGIFGADKLEAGEIYYKGKRIDIHSPSQAIAMGITMVPEDRKSQGVVLKLSVGWNLTMANLKRLSRGLVIDRDRENKLVNEYKEALSIKMNDINQPVSSLSGGNQQKVVVSKWLASNPELIIFDEPTRGIDVGAKKEIYTLINKLADQGLGVVLISSEMDEMIGLSDRMIILSEGEIKGSLERREFEKQRILDLESGNK